MSNWLDWIRSKMESEKKFPQESGEGITDIQMRSNVAWLNKYEINT